MKVLTHHENLLFSTVRLETENEVGTAFVVHHAWEGVPNGSEFLVTCRHVVERASRGAFWFVSRDGDEPALGRWVTARWRNFEEGWTFHPDPKVDVAILPVSAALSGLRDADLAPFYRSISTRLVRTNGELSDELDVVESVSFIGYPSGMFDVKNQLPIVRRATTATPPYIDYNGQPAFLIDGSVFPGSSGSPVLILDQVAGRLKEAESPLESERCCLGFWQLPSSAVRVHTISNWGRPRT